MPATATHTRRIVVADDSALMRRLLADALVRQGFAVVGEAADGDGALALCQRERPDALTLDLQMPGLDGLGVLRALRERRAAPVPVVVVSAFSPAAGARAVDALAEGAYDLVAKPAVGESLGAFCDELGRKVSEAAGAPGGHARRLATRPHVPLGDDAPAADGLAARRSATGTVVVIACSTGGPRALGALVPALPAPLGAGGILIQHMPQGFTASLAARLDARTALSVREARPGDVLDPSALLVAPGGAHLRVGADRRLRLADDAPVGGLRPRADLTVADLARTFGRRVLLVVLTGMGRDGVEGAWAVKRAGGRVLCEAESSCAVYGMPRAVADAGLADAVLPLDKLARAVARELA